MFLGGLSYKLGCRLIEFILFFFSFLRRFLTFLKYSFVISSSFGFDVWSIA